MDIAAARRSRPAGRAAALAALSRFAAAHPEIAEIEINPLVVAAGGAWALDARIILDQGGSHARR